MKKTIAIVIAFLSFVFLSLKVSTPGDSSIGVDDALRNFELGVDDFVVANEQLYEAVEGLNADSASIVSARNALKDCRRSYKRIAFFTSYFLPSETRFYNGAPKFEVEEPTLELVEPMGLQQIEALLFEDDVLAGKSDLLVQSEAMLTSARDMHSLLFGIKINDAQILESVRIELIRITTLYISGYDAPMLKSGINETLEATNALQNALKPYFEANPDHSKSLALLISNSQSYLKAHQDFDSFNRMAFLTQFALPMQKQFGEFISRLDLVINTTSHLNYEAPHIYSKNALKSWDDHEGDSMHKMALADLGRTLFFDKSLSGDASTSCATCHQPGNYFADQLQKSPSLVRDSVLRRNTPTLMYAGWQHSQFWDGRVANLQDQIHNVFLNPLEMNGNAKALSGNVLQKDKYKKLIKASFPDKKVQELGINEASEALAAFIKQLGPMDSPFDQYIAGNQTALTDRQVNGFNLFMGKAQCGTCHFPPFFNSLLPPLFDISEVEVLGITATDDFEKPELDTDLGRFDLYKMRYYKGAFKTPTVRNSAKTAPYMHNGSFKSLAKVMDFYNKGGGRSLALEVEEQTLSSKPLNLSELETEDIILFLESLTDSKPENQNFSN
ncbi:cytochrome C peroxidase [Dyadobacter sp. CY107]|uniref:cytochrome-c peroxidase n=1 Tax=Dyadobacter fanqingshengii TaxID=2906443 RepID=UPI001F34B7B3|nr:cytochrome c peroxidase [Dyadobacter fanqingshengii]MCF2504739.1 cytochrome C peroxidase [Dyadobacter fanqingshengii]